MTLACHESAPAAARLLRMNSSEETWILFLDALTAATNCRMGVMDAGWSVICCAISVIPPFFFDVLGERNSRYWMPYFEFMVSRLWAQSLGLL